MEKLNNDSLIFLCDLLNCILDDINITLYTSSDSDLIERLCICKNKISSSYQILNNFLIMRGLLNGKN